MSNEIKTPLTDSEAIWTTFEDGFHDVEKCAPEKGHWVPINFARQLERELSAAKAEIARLKHNQNENNKSKQSVSSVLRNSSNRKYARKQR